MTHQNLMSLLRKIILIEEITRWLLFMPTMSQAPPTQTESQQHPQKIVVLDAGHDKKFVGARYAGVLEENQTLKTVLALQPVLEKENYKVILTRKDMNPLNKQNIDRDKDGKKRDDELLLRSELADKVQADYFFSIHFNALANNHKSYGVGIYYYGITNSKQLSDGKINSNLPTEKYYEVDTISRKAALEIGEFYKAKHILVQIRGRDSGLLRGKDLDKTYIQPQRVSLIIEPGYLTNKEDREQIKKDPLYRLGPLIQYLKKESWKGQNEKERKELSNSISP